MPKIVDREQYRQELLSKSFDLFATKGYATITMRQIAQGIGVSTGTLYHYFESKEALFSQLMAELTQQDVLNFMAEAGNAQTLSEKIDALMSFVAKNEDYFLKQALLLADYFQHQDQVEGRDARVLQDSWEQTKLALTEYLQLRDRAIADFILHFLDGLITGRLFQGESASFIEQGELLKKMLTAYLD
jgi:AcrR family transcriptional regulator